MDIQNSVQKVPKRILASLISSVSAGVVPRLGAPYMVVGRNDEIDALLSDLKNVSEGMSSMRFIIGKYGSGKSFLMQLVRGYAIERSFICADADLSPERRLCGRTGSGLATYRELMRNLSSKSSPGGGALAGIISKWLSDIQMSLVSDGFDIQNEEFIRELEKRVFAKIRKMEDRVGGFDFALILCEYFKAEREENDEKKSACLRWLRGEYANKSEARMQTGLKLSSVIDDDNFYDYIKLWAVFFKEIGYGGFVVFIDECVNLYKIPNRISRENNYEKILSMFNDTLQGKAEGLALIFAGTPQFLEDTRRGLYSYDALKSRLCDSRFLDSEYRNFLNPVIRLRRLSDNELLALTVRISALYEQYREIKLPVTADDMAHFLEICLEKAGADLLVTPREIIRDYITVLNILIQNPDLTFDEIIKRDKDKIAKAEAFAHDELPDTGNTDTKRYETSDIEF